MLYKHSIFALICLVFSFKLLAVELNTNVDGVLVKGYDVVAYFDGTPEKGLKTYKATHQGATLYFANQANLEKFNAAPEMYFPRFGGYCAFGARHGKKLDIDPTAYAVEGGQLYLLLNPSTKAVWDTERQRNIALAEKNWPAIKAIAPEKLNQ